MKQQTLALAANEGAVFEQYRRATRRDVFLYGLCNRITKVQLNILPLIEDANLVQAAGVFTTGGLRLPE